MSNTSVHKSSSKKAATADSDEEASQMSGEDHTQNVFSTDNSFEQNSTSNKKSGSKKVSSKKRSSRRKNSASDVDDDEEESEVGSLPEDEEILSSEESSSGSDDDDDDDDDEESSEDSSRDDDDDDWEKGSSKKKVSKKHAKSHKSAAKQTKPKVKAAKKASAKKTSVNKKQKGGENSKKRTISDVEDGEVSDNGHGSSSDASSVFNDGYDSDLIGDEEDRRKLDAMTEKEREEEIYRRTEQRDLLKKQFEMRKKLSRKQKEEARLKRHEEKKKSAKKSQKQVASSDDDHVQMRDNDLDDDDERNDESAQKQAAVEIMDRRKVNESKRKNTDVSKALANLKADREKKKQQAEDQRQKLQQQQQQKKLRAEDVFSSSSDEEKPSKSKHSQESSQKRHSSSEFSDESSDENESEMSSDENDEDDKNSKRSIEKKEDLNKIKLSRFRIEKWCHAPFFKDVACGCFVRIGIGLNQGVNIYRVAEVVEIVETAKVYSMGTTKTNKGFRLRHGREERIYRLEFVSNQPFTDDEFNRWKENMQKNNLPLPTMRQVENKGKELQSFINYRFKDEDLDHIIQEKKRFVKDTDKIADRKIALLKQREEAVQTNDPERVKEIDLLIEELNEKAIEVNTKRSGNFNLLAAINKRNRVTSNQMVEEAMRNEYARLQETKDDPFQRRKALPTLVAAIKKNTSSQELPKSDSQEKKKEEKKPEVAKKNPLKPPIPTFEDILAPTSLQKPIDETKPNQSILNFSAKISETIITTHGSNSTAHSDDLFQAHNFDININLSIPMPSNQIQTPQSYGNGTGVNNLSRRSLNLDEYKKKKGLI